MAKRKKPSTVFSPANEPPAAAHRSKRPTRPKTEKMEDHAALSNEQTPATASSPVNKPPAAASQNLEDSVPAPSNEQTPVEKMEIPGGGSTVEQQLVEDKPESSQARKGSETDSAEITEEPDEEAMEEAEMDEMADNSDENLEVTDSRRRRRGRRVVVEGEVANLNRMNASSLSN